MMLAPTAAASPAPVIQPFGTVIRGSGGGTIALTEYATAPNLTVLGITFTPGDNALEGYSISTPTLTYGARGYRADVDYSQSDAFFSGVVAPHTSVTLDYAYEVDKSQLNPATLTVHIGLEDFTWTGDLAGKLLPPPPPRFGSS
ncbi:hypothetical protein [Rhodococcus sp. PSBB049]|uniref:hypothetical protein n=1 Tax=Rhodococcus sp. PSBB049 TaxID=2812863 RepID=UPI00197DC586|nr:hypothetical protein [Rhodococcus sp. PSBB049]QSE72497.1 hypothetical protein JYA91_29745 [Rhodococcus sp. PSBB049]